MNPSIRPFALPAAAFTLLAACSAATDPTSTGSTGAPLTGTLVGREPGLPCTDFARAPDGGPASFTACTVDEDCVAVPQVGCCDNGWRAAVNRCAASEYEDSFACPQLRPICPQYRVDDTRQPRCVSDACTMVSPRDTD
jgi:hypothetical protein